MAVKTVLELKPNGLLYCGVPCASYSFMSSSRHKRTESNPLGDVNSHWVRDHNTLVCRVALLLVLALVRRVHFFIEHPWSSVLPLLPWFRDIAGLHAPQLFNFQVFHIKWPRGSFIIHAESSSSCSFSCLQDTRNCTTCVTGNLHPSPCCCCLNES